MTGIILRDLLITGIIAAVGFMLKSLWKYITSDNDTCNNKLDTKSVQRIKKQFFGFLIALVISLVLPFLVTNFALSIACRVLSVLSFFIVWGAFEVVYDFTNCSISNHCGKIPGETTDYDV